MAIAFVAAADLGNSTATSRTISYTCGSGSNRLLIVTVQGDLTTDDITSVTYNGVAMTQINKTLGARWMYMYYLLNPASGANNVVATFGSSHFIGLLGADYTGVAQSGQPDASTINTYSYDGYDTTTALTTVAANAWCVIYITGIGGAPPAVFANGNCTRRTYDAANLYGGFFDSGPVVTPGSNSTTQSWNAGSLSAVLMASFAPASTFTWQDLVPMSEPIRDTIGVVAY